MTFPNDQGQASGAIPVYLTFAGQAYQAGSGGQTYILLNNATATGAAITGVAGASYIWNVVGTFTGATVKLQSLASDGVTYQDIAGASMTSGGSIGVVVGNNATIKAVVTGGSPTGLYSTLT